MALLLVWHVGDAERAGSLQLSTRHFKGNQRTVLRTCVAGLFVRHLAWEVYLTISDTTMASRLLLRVQGFRSYKRALVEIFVVIPRAKNVFYELQSSAAPHLLQNYLVRKPFCKFIKHNAVDEYVTHNYDPSSSKITTISIERKFYSRTVQLIFTKYTSLLYFMGLGCERKVHGFFRLRTLRHSDFQNTISGRCSSFLEHYVGEIEPRVQGCVQRESKQRETPDNVYWNGCSKMWH